ncbi:MAG TPA: hypothetical protein VKT70_02215 [Stellaceae bacterium]|nr:hypothetical protein [Stellaceae bacterium]
MSFPLGRGATFEDLAIRLAEIEEDRFGPPVHIDVTLSQSPGTH